MSLSEVKIKQIPRNSQKERDVREDWADYGLNLLRALRDMEERKTELDAEAFKLITDELWEIQRETVGNLVIITV